jgi:DNA-binding phage protein
MKARRIHKTMTPAERREFSERVRLVEQGKPELMSLGKKLREQHARVVASILHELNVAKDTEGLSLADLMEKTGIDRATLSRLFRETSNPTLLTLNRVAEALGRELVVELRKPG